MQDPSSQPTENAAGRRLRRGFVLLVAGDVAGKLVWFYAILHSLTAALGSQVYGQFEVAFNVTFGAALVIESGLGPFGARAVARVPADAARLVARITLLRGLLVAVAAGTCLVIAASGRLSPTATSLLLVYPLYLVARAALTEWLFQGRGEMGTVVLGNLLEQAVMVLGVNLFVRAPQDVLRVPFIQAGACGIVVAFHRIAGRLRTGPMDFSGAARGARAIAAEAWPLSLSTIAWAARFFAPPVALGLANPSADIGAFGAAHRLVVAMHAVVWLWFFNLLPTWSRLAHGDETDGGERLSRAVWRSTLITGGFAVGLIAGVLALAGVVTGILGGPDFAAAAGHLKVMCLVPAIAFLSGNMRFGLVARGQLRGEMVGALVATAAGICCYAAAGRDLDPPRAALVFVGAEATNWVMVTLLWFLLKPSRRGEPRPSGQATTAR